MLKKNRAGKNTGDKNYRKNIVTTKVISASFLKSFSASTSTMRIQQSGFAHHSQSWTQKKQTFF